MLRYASNVADERTALLLWMQQQDTSPVTGEPLKPDFRRNRALQHVIRSWVEVCLCSALILGSSSELRCCRWWLLLYTY